MLLLAVVKDEELARHLLFDLDHFTKWNSLHYQWVTRQGQSLYAAATGEGGGYGRTSSSSCRDSMSRESARDALHFS
jgi:hypothetical protein